MPTQTNADQFCPDGAGAMTEYQSAISTIALTNARHEALESICGDHYNDSLERARISLVKVKGANQVMRDGFHIATIPGRFSRKQLRKTLADSLYEQGAKTMAAVKAILEQELVIDDEYLFTMSIEDSLRWMETIRSRQFSARIRRKVPDSNDPAGVSVEFRFWINKADGFIDSRKGKPYLGQFKSFITDGHQHPRAQTHEELARMVARQFNESIAVVGWR